jgi:hypothetical protein
MKGKLLSFHGVIQLVFFGFFVGEPLVNIFRWFTILLKPLYVLEEMIFKGFEDLDKVSYLMQFMYLEIDEDEQSIDEFFHERHSSSNNNEKKTNPLRLCLFLLLFFLSVPLAIMAGTVQYFYNLIAKYFLEWQRKRRVRLFPYRKLKARGSLKDAGLPLLDGARYLDSGYFEFRNGLHERLDYRYTVGNFKFYGNLEIVPMFRTLFNTTNSSIADVLQRYNLVGDNSDERKLLINSFKSAFDRYPIF